MGLSDNRYVTLNAFQFGSLVLVFALPGYLVLDADDYSIGPKIASGGFASVRHAKAISDEFKNRVGNTKIVAKIISMQSQFFDIQSLKIVGNKSSGSLQFDQEVSLLHQYAKYPFFSRIFGFDPKEKIILMKLYSEKCLYDYLMRPSKYWSKSLLLQVALSVARGIKIMHNKNMAHCDLKGENILLNFTEAGKLEAVIADFGLTRIFGTQKVKHLKIFDPNGLSIHYAAPEVFLEYSYIEKTQQHDRRSPAVLMSGDVYAFGCLLNDMLNRKFGYWR